MLSSSSSADLPGGDGEVLVAVGTGRGGRGGREETFADIAEWMCPP